MDRNPTPAEVLEDVARKEQDQVDFAAFMDMVRSKGSKARSKSRRSSSAAGKSMRSGAMGSFGSVARQRFSSFTVSESKKDCRSLVPRFLCTAL